MNRHTTSHSGLLVTGSGDDLEVELELIGGRTLRLSADGEEIGAWAADECRIESDPASGGSFRLLVDGEAAVFTPADPVGFRAFAERWGPTGDSVVPGGPAARAAGAGVAEPVVPADDPVAFLFGSSPPPPVRDPGVQPGVDFDPLLGHVPSTEERVERDPLGGSPQAEDPPPPDPAAWLFEDLDDAEADAAPDPLLVLDVTPDIGGEHGEEAEDAVRFEASEAVPAEPDTVEPDTVEADGIRGRLGRGSSLDRLSDAIGALKSSEDYVLDPHTVAEDVLVTQRSLRENRMKEVARGRQLKIAAIVASVVGVVALLVLLAPRALDFVRTFEGGAELPPTIPVSQVVVTTTEAADPSPSTTVPPTTAPVGAVVGAGGDGTVFDRPAPEFVSVWNALGDPVSAVLRFDSNPALGSFEQRFTPYLGLVGDVEDDGTLAGFSVVVDPTGPGEHDRLGMQALGVAIAAADPTRSPSGRAALLLDLGLNVRQPILEGIDGTVTAGGILYRLVYDPEAILLTLTVSPAA